MPLLTDSNRKKFFSFLVVVNAVVILTAALARWTTLAKEGVVAEQAEIESLTETCRYFTTRFCPDSNFHPDGQPYSDCPAVPWTYWAAEYYRAATTLQPFGEFALLFLISIPIAAV